MFSILFPNQKFFRRPKYLSQLVFTFLIIRHASLQLLNDVADFKAGLQCRRCRCCGVQQTHGEHEQKFLNFHSLLFEHIPTVQDYGVSLTLDDHELTAKLHDMCITLFANFNHSEHLRATIVQWCILKQHESANDSIHRGFVRMGSSFMLEEAGEMLLSVLGRKMSTDPKRSDHEHSASHFSIMKHVWETTLRLEGDLGCGHLQRRKMDIKMDGAEVKIMRDKLRDVFAEHKRVVVAERKHPVRICLKCHEANNDLVDFRSDRCEDALHLMDDRIKHNIAAMESRINDWLSEEKLDKWCQKHLDEFLEPDDVHQIDEKASQFIFDDGLDGGALSDDNLNTPDQEDHESKDDNMERQRLEEVNDDGSSIQGEDSDENMHSAEPDSEVSLFLLNALQCFFTFFVVTLRT